MINKLYKMRINSYMKKEQKKYKNTNHLIVYEKDYWKIRFNNYTYIIKTVKQKNEYYIRLTPYQKTYFQTKLNLKDIASQVPMTLFAMKENEELYRHD